MPGSAQAWSSMCALLLSVLSGCASYNPSDYYDTQAIEKMGRVVNKTVARAEVRDSGEFHAPIFLPVTINGVSTFISGKRTRQAAFDIFEYRVEISRDQIVSVYSEYPGFNVGECAKVFLSQQPSYPRIAPGYDCEK